MGDRLLDSGILPASDYNRIKCLEEQPTISQSLLRHIGQIYVRNKMHHDYGAGTIHRHNPICEGDAMVHRLHENGTDVCNVEHVKDLDCSDIHPHSFCLNSRGQFQAYEYEIGPSLVRPLPHEKFLYQLRSFLTQNRLADLVAVVAEDSRPDSLEYLLPDNKGMVSIPRKEGYMAGDGQPIITSWKFNEAEDGTIECVQRRGCDPKDDGQHKLTTDAVFKP